MHRFIARYGDARLKANADAIMNAAMLHTRNNTGFFKGTVVEQAVADKLGLEKASPAATA